MDENFRTTQSHIFAAGDVIGYPSLAATSSEQGRLAACAAFGVNAIPMLKHFPIGVYSVPGLSMGGGLDYFLETVFNYPTLAECYKVAALDAHNKLLL